MLLSCWWCKGKTDPTWWMVMFPHLVSYCSAWGGKQQLISRTSGISPVLSSSAAFGSAACPCPDFFCHLPSPQTRFFAGAAVRSPGSTRYLQDQRTAAPVPLQGPHVPPAAFPALGSLLVFIMQLYSSQNRSLYFIHPFAMCLPEQGDIMLALQKAN